VDRDRSDDELDPEISLGLVVRMRMSKVRDVRDFFQELEGARLVVAKVAGPRRLWLIEADHEPQREGRS